MIFLCFFPGGQLQLRHVQDDLLERVRAQRGGRHQVHPRLRDQDQRSQVSDERVRLQCDKLSEIRSILYDSTHQKHMTVYFNNGLGPLKT